MEGVAEGPRALLSHTENIRYYVIYCHVIITITNVII